MMSDWLKDRPIMESNNSFESIVSLLRGEVDELVEAHPNGDNYEIEQELADVFIFAFTLANILKVDVETVVKEKMGYNQARYPAFEFQEGDYTEARERCRDWVKDTNFKEVFVSI